MRLIFQLFLLFFFLVEVYASESQQFFSISGRVTAADTEEPVDGAVIFIHETNDHAITDKSGRYTISNVRRGSYHLHVQILGFETVTQNINLQKDIVNLDFRLKPTSLELQQITIEADFLQSGRKEQSLNIDAVGEHFIERNLANTFVQTIEKVPGITSMNIGSGLSKPVIRGMSNNRVIVNQLGIKQENQQWGSDHGLEVDAYNVARIEVVKGPASLLYGSDGMGGVINILPQPVPQQGSLSGDILTQYKSNNDLYGFSAGLEGNTQKNKFFHLRYSLQDFADYKVPADSFVYNRFRLPIYNNRLKNTAGQQQSALAAVGLVKHWGKIRLTGSWNQQQAGLFPGAVGVPRSYQLTHDDDFRNIDLPRQQNEHMMLNANSHFNLGNGRIFADVGLQDNRRLEESQAHSHGIAAPVTDDLALGLRLKTFTINTRYRMWWENNLKLITGVSYQGQQNTRSGFEFLIPDYSSHSTGAFVFLNKHYEKWFLNGGLRADYGSVDIQPYFSSYINGDGEQVQEQRSPAIDRDFWNYSGGAGVSFVPHQYWNFKLNIGRSFRLPSPAELASNGIHHGTFRHEQGDAGLQPETGWQFDLGITHNQEDWQLRFTPFFNYFDNFIYLRPTGQFSLLPEAGQVYKYTQAEAVHSGFEAQAEFHPFEQLHLSAMGEYVYNLNLDNGLPLPFTPPLILSAEVEYTFADVGKVLQEPFVELRAVRFSEQLRVDRNESPTPAYAIFNLTAGTNFSISKQELRLYFGVHNLFNNSYMNHLSRYRILNLPEQGRNFTLTLKVPVKIIMPE